MSDDLNPPIPDFLKRTETAEQIAKREAQEKKAQNKDSGLKVTPPYCPPPEAVRKAIARDLADKPDRKPKSFRHVDESEGGERKLVQKAPIAQPRKGKPQKPASPLIAKALKERERLNARVAETKPTHPAKAEAKKENDMAKKSKKTKRTNYDWNGAMENAKSKGTLPPVPDFSANTHRYFRDALADCVKLVKAKNVKALQAMKFPRADGSPGMIKRYRDIALIALKA